MIIINKPISKEELFKKIAFLINDENLRPSQNNRSRSVEDPDLRQQITKLINQYIK